MYPIAIVLLIQVMKSLVFMQKKSISVVVSSLLVIWKLFSNVSCKKLVKNIDVFITNHFIHTGYDEVSRIVCAKYIDIHVAIVGCHSS